MRNLGDLSIVPVWLNPHHTVMAAKLLMSGFNVRAIGIMEGRLLLGVVTKDQLAGVPDEAPLESIMQVPPIMLDKSVTMHKAAEKLAEAGSELAAIFENDTFAGLITAGMLLRHLLRPWDARTGLGSGERLREWGVDMLKDGREISILFLDLNDFKKYNKEHGHPFGDKVLRRVANFLKDCTDPKRDLLVRYGGDEFAVGTLRTREEAEELGRVILERAEAELFDEAQRPITFCIGVSGGRRSILRDGLHPDATYDDLVTAASKAALAAKEELKARRRFQSPPEPYEVDLEGRR